MRLKTIVMAATTALVCAAGAAQAATVLSSNTTASFSGPSQAPFRPVGFTDITVFAAPTSNIATATAALSGPGGLDLSDAKQDGVLSIPAGYSLVGSALVEQGSYVDISAAPGITPVGSQDTSPYLSVQVGQNAEVTLPRVHQLSMYIGSLDSYNNFTFNYANGTSDNFSGGNLASIVPDPVDNGDWTASNSNGLYIFTFNSPLTSISLTSGQNAFEIADIAAAVPEPATWAMMVMGFFGLGALMRAGRRQQERALAAA